MWGLLELKFDCRKRSYLVGGEGEGEEIKRNLDLLCRRRRRERTMERPAIDSIFYFGRR